MRILLIGASSYLGMRLYFDLFREHELTGTCNAHQLLPKFVPLDITNQAAVSQIIEQKRPELIIHTANHPSVDWCEEHPDDAVCLNQTATEYIVTAANKVGSKVIYISSFAALNPTNLYGKTKQSSEEMIKTTQKGHLIIRPSLIVGLSPNMSNERPFNRILKALDGTGPAEFDNSWQFQPSYIGHITEVIKAYIAEKITHSLVLPVVIDELKTQFDIARDILANFGLEPIPINRNLPYEVIREDVTELNKLGLSFYDYPTMIKKIAEEIQKRQLYSIG